MSVIFILIIISASVAGVFLIAFIWSVKTGQYEDTYSPSIRILFDENLKAGYNKKKSEPNSNSQTSTEPKGRKP